MRCIFLQLRVEGSISATELALHTCSFVATSQQRIEFDLQAVKAEIEDCTFQGMHVMTSPLNHLTVQRRCQHRFCHRYDTGAQFDARFSTKPSHTCLQEQHESAIVMRRTSFAGTDIALSVQAGEDKRPCALDLKAASQQRSAQQS